MVASHFRHGQRYPQMQPKYGRTFHKCIVFPRSLYSTAGRSSSTTRLRSPLRTSRTSYSRRWHTVGCSRTNVGLVSKCLGALNASFSSERGMRRSSNVHAPSLSSTTGLQSSHDPLATLIEYASTKEILRVAAKSR
jgi:hypothetical protein